MAALEASVSMATLEDMVEHARYADALRVVRAQPSRAAEVLLAECDAWWKGCTPDIVRELIDASPRAVKMRARRSNELPLHKAMQYGAPAEVLRLLIDAYPEGLRVKNTYSGTTPLHYAAASADVPVDVVRMMIDAFPKGVQHKDEHGALPLHYAVDRNRTEAIRILLDAYPAGIKEMISYSHPELYGSCFHIAMTHDTASTEILRMLMDAYPEGVKVKDESGALPLHAACLSKKGFTTDVEAVRMLFEAYPEGASVKMESSRIVPLHLALVNRAPTEVVRMLLDAYPQGVKEEVVVEEGELSGLPLHHALCDDYRHLEVSAEVVRIIFDAYPEGAKHNNEIGNLPLHNALANKAPVEVVRMLLDAYPEGAAMKNKDDALPLHNAAANQAPAEVVRMLLDAYPEGATMKNKDGSLPLHIAAANQAHADVVRMLLDAYPEGVKDTDNEGALPPLHIALANQAPAEVVRMLLDAYPEGATMKNKDGSLPLHIAAANQARAEVVRMVLDAYPEGATVKNNEDALPPLQIALANHAPAEVVRMLLDAHPEGVKDTDNEDALPPLHIALANQAPAEVVRMLLDAYAEGATVKNKDDALPLHIAAANQAPAEVVRMVLDAHPEGVKDTDNEDALPLHIALANQAAAEVMRLLIDAYPEGATMKNKDGSLPLYDALQRNALAEVVRMLLDAYPEGVKDTDNEDALPLHIALANQAPAEVVRMLLDAYAEGATVKNKDDALPLHIAAANQAPAEVVRMLLDAHPEGVKDTDNEDALPLHIAVKHEMPFRAFQRGEDCLRGLSLLEAIRMLLDAYPEGVKMKVEDDALPLHIAVKHRSPPEVIRMLLDEYPEGVQENFQNMIIDVVESSPYIDYCDVLKWLLDAYPGDGFEEREDRVELFRAALQGGNPEVMRTLLDAYPNAAKEPMDDEERGSILLHLAVETVYRKRDTDDREICLNLLRVIIDAYPDGLQCKDQGGLSPIDMAISVGYEGEDILAALLTSRYFLGMYELHTGVPAHRSRTCVVLYATEHPANTPVALKFMRSREQFDREVNFRQNRDLDSKHVMNVIRSHTAFGGNEEFDTSVKSFLASRLDDASSIQCCLVLPRADFGLHAALAHEHFAGTNILKVRQVAMDVAVALQHVHEQGIIHGDVKPLNIMQCANRYLLIDLDCACRIGERFGTKQPSTGYCPPEMARAILADDITSYTASPTYDLWSLGVLLFLLYTGQTLFHNEINDDIAQHDQLVALANQWDERRLEQTISVPAFADDARAEMLIDLIRWLLRTDASERPQSVAEALKHAFFQEDVSKGVHGLHGSVSPGIFVSHYQEGGGGPTARQLKHDLSAEQRWLERHIWLDVDQKHINEEAMKAGVKSHRHFLVLLTKGYFERWFCKLELQTAIQNEREIVLVHETRPDLGGYASFGDYISEFKQQTQDGKLYADFPEANQIFNVDSIPLYHEETLDPISVKRILARINVSEPPSNAPLLAAAMRVPQGARLAVLSSGSGTRQAKTAIADMRQVCPAMTCTSSVDAGSHVVVVFVSRGVPEEFGDLVASLREQRRCVIALYQVDERKGYDGVRHKDLASDARWQAVPAIPWVVYRDFREAALTRVLNTLAFEAERTGVSSSMALQGAIAESTGGSVKGSDDIVLDDVRSLDLTKQLESEREHAASLSKRVAQMEAALWNRDKALKRREYDAWVLQRQVALLQRQVAQLSDGVPREQAGASLRLPPLYK